MAFQKKTWKDRITEFPTRRTLTKSDGSTELVTVARAEGTVSQEGDAFNAASMNDLEERINQANNDLSERINSGLTNESQETFNFGVKDGVRGFFTNPSRADDCFIPFKSGSGWFYTGTASIAGSTSKTITISCSDYSDYKNLTAERIKVGITGSTNTGNSWSSNGVHISISNYNASNGTITIKVNNSNSDICTTNISYIVCII